MNDDDDKNRPRIRRKGGKCLSYNLSASICSVFDQVKLLSLVVSYLSRRVCWEYQE
jgi:hypothetical protein